MADFTRDYIKEHLPELSPKEQEDALGALPVEVRLADLTVKQIREYLGRMTASESAGRARRAGESNERPSRPERTGLLPNERRSAWTSLLLDELFERYRGEGLPVAHTMECSKCDHIKNNIRSLSQRELEDVLSGLPSEVLLAGLPEQEIREYLDRVASGEASGRRE
jgi:hypothetical protein